MSWQSLAIKEFKEHVRPADKWSGTMIAAVVLSLLMAIGGTVGMGFMVHRFGSISGEPVALTTSVVLAMLAGLAGATFPATLIPMNLGVDAIAGERERHTLETLLAGPVSDKGILWAKLLAIEGVAILASVIGALGVWVALVILYAQHGLLWGLLTLPIGLVAPIVPTFMFSCLAFIFSARAKTVKDAGQRMSYVLLPIMIVPSLLPALGGMSPTLFLGAVLLAVAMGVVMLVAVPLLAFLGFRRERLLI